MYVFFVLVCEERFIARLEQQNAQQKPKGLLRKKRGKIDSLHKLYKICLYISKVDGKNAQ